MPNAQIINSQEYYSSNESSHHYRTEIPNIIFEMGLDPYELSLYCYLKKTAGDNGACWKSIQTLCEETKFGRTKLMKVKASLESKGLIKISKRNNPTGGKSSDLITIVDLWSNNMKRMAEKFPDKHISIKQTEVVRQTNGGGPPNGHKEEPNKEEPNKQQQAAAVSFDSEKIVPLEKSQHLGSTSDNICSKTSKYIHDCLKEIDIPTEEKVKISQRYSFEIVKNALEWTLDQKEYHKGFLAALYFACYKKLKKEIIKPKMTIYECLSRIFKHGGLYESIKGPTKIECYLNEEAIAFQIGMKHQQMSLKYFSWDNFKEMCNNFGIKFKKEMCFA